MTLVEVLIVGLAVGAHVATWGAYKDSPYEGFHWSRFVRSIALSVVLAAVIAWLVAPARPSLVVLLGVVYCLERLITEFWKLFFRGHAADTFTIPMRFSIFGKTLDAAGARYTLGVLLSLGCVGAIWFVDWLQPALPRMPQVVAIAIASISGWLTAVGGAWKDAPIEGFSGWKFLRSPVVAGSWAIPLSFLSDDWVLLGLSAGGFAVASIETYKAFLVRGRPPGKFDGKPVRFTFSHRRQVLAGAHALLWAGLAVSLLMGLAGRQIDSVYLAQAAVALLALVWSALTMVRAVLNPVPAPA
ncbi:MAG: hypothetical protein V9F00_02150 [Nocardioides sp.]